MEHGDHEYPGVRIRSASGQQSNTQTRKVPNRIINSRFYQDKINLNHADLTVSH